MIQTRGTPIALSDEQEIIPTGYLALLLVCLFIPLGDALVNR
jgi:hypothetical protein